MRARGANIQHAATKSTNMLMKFTGFVCSLSNELNSNKKGVILWEIILLHIRENILIR